MFPFSSLPITGVLELRCLWTQTPMQASVSYPAVPSRASYTSCYCEENIYLLAASFLEKPDLHESWDLTVVFISNCTKTVSDSSPRLGRFPFIRFLPSC